MVPAAGVDVDQVLHVDQGQDPMKEVPVAALVAFHANQVVGVASVDLTAHALVLQPWVVVVVVRHSASLHRVVHVVAWGPWGPLDHPQSVPLAHHGVA